MLPITPPNHLQAMTKQIAFLTDIHLNEQFTKDHSVDAKKHWEQALASLTERNIDTLIFGGDIGDASAHPYFFETLKRFSFQLILGNHDKFGDVARHFNPSLAASELYYATEDETFKYLFLDSSAYAVSAAQLAWLRTALVTTKVPLVFIHHPVLPVNTAIDRIYPLKNRDQVLEVLLASHQDVWLFCGHYHMNDETDYSNIRQIATQALSFQIDKHASELKIDNSTFGYRILRLENRAVETELVTFQRR